MAHRGFGLNDIFEHNVIVRENLTIDSGTIQQTPVNSLDIVNKSYCDTNAGDAAIWEIDGTETQLIIADEIDMQSKKIINLLDPTNNQDAATKKYVDDNAGGGVDAGFVIAMAVAL